MPSIAALSRDGRDEVPTGVWIAAVGATVISLFSVGSVVLRWVRPEHRKLAMLVMIVMLPIQPLVFYLLRTPLLVSLQTLFGSGDAMIAAGLLAAPLTEEPAKWLALASVGVRAAVRSGSALGLAMAVGLGFGIGEIWFIAEQLSRIPTLQAAPATQFWGFVVERTAVCILHGLFVVPLFYALAIGRHFVLAALAGLLAHLLTNLPILAVRADLFELGPASWSWIALLWPIVLVVAGFCLLKPLSRRQTTSLRG